jgi:malonyl-ACP O-methyltransferase BioC
MMDKHLIRDRFERSFLRHADATVIQPDMAKHLARLVEQETKYSSFSKVLELGCGSSPLAPLLLDHVSVDRWVANDLVPMQDELRATMQKLPLKEFEYLQGDMEKLDLPNQQNLIVSNAAFQWLADPMVFLPRLAELLAPGGVLAFSTFGPENLREIRELTGVSLKYISGSDYTSVLSGAGSILCREERLSTVAFDSPADILRHLKQTGVNALVRKAWTKGDLSEFSDAYRAKFGKGDRVELTYHPVYVIFQRHGAEAR